MKVSRIEKTPLTLSENIKLTVEDGRFLFSNGKDSLAVDVPSDVVVKQEESQLFFSGQNIAMMGTVKALMNNAMEGLTKGFEKRLKLVGVGYRASLEGKTVVLLLGYSNPVRFPIPEDVTITAQSPTELVVQGINKQRVGQVAADIRSLRAPEPYKGKGVRYADEVIILKEVDKK